MTRKFYYNLFLLLSYLRFLLIEIILS